MYYKKVKYKLDILARKLRNFRNKFLMMNYLSKECGANDFILKHQSLRNNILVSVISFNNPWVIKLMIDQWSKNIGDGILLVFDNSNDIPSSTEIRNICLDKNVPYLKLPENKTTHVNRSHAQAMQYVYTNIISKLTPSIFGFVDHDCIPFNTYSISKHVGQKNVYGVRFEGAMTRSGRAWYVWAGFIFFNYQAVQSVALNFLYDFSLDLDTAGMNYHVLYKKMTMGVEDFTTNAMKGFTVSDGEAVELQIIDDCWWHIGGIGYNGNHIKKQKLIEEVCCSIDLLSDKSSTRLEPVSFCGSEGSR